MNLHLKVKTGSMEIVEKIAKLCKDTDTAYRLEDYKYFIVIEVNTDCKSELSAIFHEKHYNENKYVLSLYSHTNHDNEVEIPVEYIDCLFKL